MMIVKTTIKESDIHGIGLFADEFIPKGTVIWEFTEGFDVRFTDEQLKNLPIIQKEYIEKYMWLSKTSGKYCHCADNGKYCNHSKDNNVQSYYLNEYDEVVSIALKDIEQGEEILDDYNSFDGNGVNF